MLFILFIGRIYLNMDRQPRLEWAGSGIIGYRPITFIGKCIYKNFNLTSFTFKWISHFSAAYSVCTLISNVNNLFREWLVLCTQGKQYSLCSSRTPIPCNPKSEKGTLRIAFR